MAGGNALELTKYIKAAARLRRELSPFEADKALTADGGTVLYAIDTNIVWLFLDPKRLGPRHDWVGGYTHVFPSDDDHLAEALAAALSRYILYQLNTVSAPDGRLDVPLLLLDGHDAEVRSTYDRLIVHADEHAAIRGGQVRELKERLAWLTEAPDVGAQVERLRESAQSIIEWLYLDDSPQSQANRLGRLLTGGRLARLQAGVERIALAVPEERRPAVRAAFSPPRDLLAQMAEIKRRNDWEKMLRDYKNTERQGQSLRVDAVALARLEGINAMLKPERIRVCLITGDNAMINAAAGYIPDGNDDAFTDAYIRHPRAFLAADEVLTPTAQPNPERSASPGLVSGWLDTLLAQFTDDQGPDAAALTRLVMERGAPTLHKRAGKVLEADPRALATLSEQWLAHTSAIRDEHAASSNLAQGEIKRLIGDAAFSDINASLDGLQQELSATSGGTWDTYYRAVVRTGFDLVQAGDHLAGRRRRRNAPAVNFETFSLARSFVREVIAAKGLRAPPTGEIDERLAGIEQQGGGYAVLLAYAVLFADAGRWHVALLTAKRAIAVANLYEDRNSTLAEVLNLSEEVRRRVSGREAYYFAAVAQRLTARSLSDVAKAAHYLERARLSLQRDRPRMDAPADSELRFDAEMLANDLTRYLLCRFTPKLALERTPSLDAMRERAFELATRSQSIGDDWARRVVERSALNNLVMIDAMTNWSERQDPRLQAGAVRLAEIVSADRASENRDLPVTELVIITGLYAEAHFGSPDRARRRRIADDLIAFQHDIESDSGNLMMPYDLERYRLMIGRIRERLAGSEIG